MLKKILRDIIPPIVFKVFRKREQKKINNVKTEAWSGPFNSWHEAKANSTGYDSANILEKCKDALLKVKNGEAVYERDSVLFDETQYSWGLLAGLQKAALENGNKLCVLDFGGSLGTTYFQNRNFLSSLIELNWCVVEQPHFVECGIDNFQNEQIEFYYSIEECLNTHMPDVILMSGVLQYLEKPYEWIAKFTSMAVPYIFLDRTAFVEAPSDIITVQNVPIEIYKASYPHRFFNELNLLDSFLKDNYEVMADFKSFADNVEYLNTGERLYWKGKLLKRKFNYG